jgi:midasin (ATPase involved in ribosome maturation)
MYAADNAALIGDLFWQHGCLYEAAVAETIGGKPMVRFRSNVMSIFAASTLVLFMSPVKSAFAQPASAAAKSFFAQETPTSQDQGQQEQQGGTQDIQDDLKEGPDTDVNEDLDTKENEAKEGEVAEMNGADKDGAFNEAETDEDRVQDQLEDQHEDTVTPPPAA